MRNTLIKLRRTESSWVKNRLFISMYHYTRDLANSRFPQIKGLDTKLFYEQMKFFKEGFNVVTMEQVISAAEGKDFLPENAVLLTFDDGYIDNYTVAFPILDEFGFQGSFFIPGKTFAEYKLLDVNKIHYILASANTVDLLSDLKALMDHYRGTEFSYPSTQELWEEYAFEGRYDGKEIVFVKQMLQAVLPEKLRGIISSELFKKYVGITEEHLAHELYMTHEQIKLLKRHGMFIGVHGYDHYRLSELPEAQMKKDIDRALNVMSEFIDKEKWVMNYPYGVYDDEVLKYVKEKGAVLGLTTDVYTTVIGKDSSLELSRLDCNDFPPKSGNYLNFL